MVRQRNEGFAELAVVIIVACFAIGGIIVAVTKKPDTPAEQIVEAVLKAEGIEYDFSAGLKHDGDVAAPTTQSN